MDDQGHARGVALGAGIALALAMIPGGAMAQEPVPEGAMTELGEPEGDVEVLAWPGYVEDGSQRPERGLGHWFRGRDRLRRGRHHRLTRQTRCSP